MWGQAIFNTDRQTVKRIIPTRVGTSISCLCENCVIEDHPHACGDKNDGVSFDNCDIGSSPRVWGQACVKNNFNPLFRIIPTRVGTSRPRRARAEALKDHPHACGDKAGLTSDVGYDDGSSPRVWGQDICEHSDNVDFGIIPTRVGTRMTA